MLYLQTLGGVAIREAEGPADPLHISPKPLALLIYLAVARPGQFIRRDLLAALFWPESRQHLARNALSRTLHRLRKVLGPDILVTQGNEEVAVDRSSIVTDALMMEEAFSRGASEEALDLYYGPFLQGFHLPDAPEFEHWVSIERGRLRKRAADASWGLALERLDSGERGQAERWALQAVSLEPVDEHAVREYLERLAASGDRLAAIRFFDRWADLLHHDLDLVPSAETEQLLDRIRSEGAGQSARSERSRLAAGRDGQTRSVRGLSGGITTERAGAAPAGHARGSGWGRWWVHGAVLVVTAAAIVLAVMSFSASRVEVVGPGGRVFGNGAVLITADFEGPAAEPELPLALQTWLVATLEDAGFLLIGGRSGPVGRQGMAGALARMRLPSDTPLDAGLACEIATRDGFSGALVGSVTSLGHDYVMSAQVLAPGSCDPLVNASAMAGREQLRRAVMEVARTLRSGLGLAEGDLDQAKSLFPATTASLAALAAFDQALEAWVAGRGETAAGLLNRALEIDPDFAAANWSLGIYHSLTGNHGRLLHHLIPAYAGRGQLSRFERQILEALYQRTVLSDPAAAAATLETALDDLPDRWRVAFVPFLSVVEAWQGRWDRTLELSREMIRKDSTYWMGYHNAWSAAWQVGDPALADSILRLWEERAPTSILGARIEHAIHHRDWATADTLCAGVTGGSRLVECGAFYVLRGKVDRARSLLDAMGRDDERYTTHGLGGQAVAAGVAVLDHLRGSDSTAWALVRRVGATTDFEDLPPPERHLLPFYPCVAAAALGEPDRFEVCGVEREDPADWDGAGSYVGVLRVAAWKWRLRAVRALSRGEAEGALKDITTAVERNFGNPQPWDFLIRGLIFDAQQRTDSAVTAYERALEPGLDWGDFLRVPIPLPFIHRRVAELCQETGDLSCARTHYHGFLDAWDEADEALQPQVAAVRSRLAQIGR